MWRRAAWAAVISILISEAPAFADIGVANNVAAGVRNDGIKYPAKCGMPNDSHRFVGNTAPQINDRFSVFNRVKGYLWAAISPPYISGLSRSWRIGNRTFWNRNQIITRPVGLKFEQAPIKTGRSWLFATLGFPICAEGWSFADIRETDFKYYLIRNVFSDWDSRIRSNPSSVRLNSGIISRLQRQINKYEADNAYDSGSGRNPIKPFGYPDLPFPETPLGALLLIFIGVGLTNRGIEHGPFIALMGGWSLQVVGGALLLLWIIPYAAIAVLDVF